MPGSLDQERRKSLRLSGTARLLCRRVSATRVVFVCLILVVGVCPWTIGRAAEDPGQRVYEGQCSRCHGPEGRGLGTLGPNLIPFSWSYDEALEQIRRPLCDMPPFPESDLSDAQVAQIVAYLKTMKE
jgi:cytochrome c553